jgi:hypothetical protein
MRRSIVKRSSLTWPIREKSASGEAYRRIDIPLL